MDTVEGQTSEGKGFPSQDVEEGETNLSTEIYKTTTSSPSLHSCSSIFKGHLNIQSMCAAIFYGVCSVSIAFFNKLLMTTYEFDFPVLIMLIQMLFTICALEVLNKFGVIILPKYTLERGKMFALPAFFYAVNSILALSALSNMNLALYGVLKRCVPVATLCLSVIILKKGLPSKLTILSVIFLTLGCIVAGYGDLSFNILGYTCGALSNIFQATYLLLVQKATSGKLTMVESLQLNSINTLPLLSLACLVKGEIYVAYDFKYFYSIQFMLVFWFTIVLGCLLNYSLFLCTSLTSALTTSVVGGMKAVAQTVIGMFTFGGVSQNIPTVTGILMSMMGSFGYIYSKYRESSKRTGGMDLRKIMSFSTVEDLKSTGNNDGSVSNGLVQTIRNEIGNR